MCRSEFYMCELQNSWSAPLAASLWLAVIVISDWSQASKSSLDLLRIKYWPKTWYAFVQPMSASLVAYTAPIPGISDADLLHRGSPTKLRCFCVVDGAVVAVGWVVVVVVFFFGWAGVAATEFVDLKYDANIFASLVSWLHRRTRVQSFVKYARRRTRRGQHASRMLSLYQLLPLILPPF